jgi:hypothetical protein
MALRLDTVTAAVLERAAELAGRAGRSDITIEHVCHALLGRPMTPALIQRLMRAAAIAEDANNDYINDLHVLQAQLTDPMSGPTQVLSELIDVSPLTQQLNTFFRVEPT